MSRYPCWFQHFCLLLTALALLSGCSSALALPLAPSPDTTLPVASPEPPDHLGGIQATLDQLAAVLNDAAADPTQVGALVDPGHPPLRRVMAEYVAATQRLAELSPAPFAFRVVATAPRSPDLVEATITRQWDQRLHTWLFRRHATGWLLSQPTSAELGAPTTHTVGPLTLTYHAWDAALAEALAPQLERGLERLHRTLAVDPATQPVQVQLRPVVDTADIAGSGFYRPGATPERDQLVIVTSGVAFGSYDPADTWATSVARTIIHEYTHRVNDRAVMPLSAMPAWMVEGLAEYVAESEHLRIPQFRTLILEGDLLSIEDLISPGPEIPRGVLYGYAQQLTTYLIDVHSIDQFWALAAAFGDASGKPDERMDQALQQTLGQNADQFDRSWRPWLIARARSFAAPGQ